MSQVAKASEVLEVLMGIDKRLHVVTEELCFIWSCGGRGFSDDKNPIFQESWGLEVLKKKGQDAWQNGAREVEAITVRLEY